MVLGLGDRPLRLTYYGHCAFGWETPGGVRALADPYRNEAGRYWFLRRFPEVRCDLGLITHAHFDHAAAGRLPESASLLRTPAELSCGDLRVRGIGDYHSGPARLRDFPNVMFRLEAGGVSLLHLGDNRADWPAAVARAVGQVDVLLVTVDDSRHLLSYGEVDGLIGRLQPRVVIPMHYGIPGLTAPESGLRTAEQWLAAQPRVRHWNTHQLELAPGSLPTAATEVWALQPSPESLRAPTVKPGQE